MPRKRKNVYFSRRGSTQAPSHRLHALPNQGAGNGVRTQQVPVRRQENATVESTQAVRDAGKQ